MKDFFKSERIIFLVTAVLMCTYLFLDVSGLYDSRIVKFITILLIACVGCITLKDRINRFAGAGLLLTVVADFFIVLIDEYIYGVSVFVAVQLCYAVYIAFLSNKVIWKELLKSIIPAVVAATVAVFSGLGSNIVVTAAYALCIGMNIARSAELYIRKPCKKYMVLMIGFVAFVCCDICVGMRRLFDVSDKAMLIMTIVTWVTYPPSQLMILASTGVFNKDKVKN